MQDLEIDSLCYVSTHRHFLRVREVKNFIQMEHRSVLLQIPLPPFDQIPKIFGVIICSEFEENTLGTLTMNFQNLSH